MPLNFTASILIEAVNYALGSEGRFMNKPGFISADSHMFEPPNLWEERIDSKFKEQAPKYVYDEQKKALLLVIAGVPPRSIMSSMAVAQKPEDYKDFFKSGLEGARPGGWDPAERLKDMDVDNVDAAVLYTSHGRWMYMIEDAGYQEACFRAYNDWIAEFCSHDPKRLIGIGLISLYDTENAVKELRRCKKMGLKGAMIWGGHALDSQEYEPLWEEAQGLEMPLTIHATSGTDREPKASNVTIWNNTFGHISKPNQAQQSLRY